MDTAVTQALQSDRTIDITTTGRRTGEARRLEIWFHNLGGRIYITGRPGVRSWYANLLADPKMTFHLKESTRADLEAVARPVTDTGERQSILGEILDRLGYGSDLDRWVEASPLVEVQFA